MNNLYNYIKKKFSFTSLLAIIFVIYALTHVYALLELPVFADEAIYIRWAQLIIDDPARYAFFPLNDGKTPFFIWLLVPFQYLFSDQLYAARFVSVLGGIVQIFSTLLLVKALGGGKKAQLLSALLITILPFWFFHHRTALMDGWLTAVLTSALVVIIHLIQEPVKEKGKLQNELLYSKNTVLKMLLAGLLIGAAFWIKLPAVLALPGFFIFLFLPKKQTLWQFIIRFCKVGGAAGIGLVVFAVLKVAPPFSQLFARGGDFLFPISSVLFEGVWQQTIPSFSNHLGYFTHYLSPVVVLFPLLAFVLPTRHRKTIFLLLCAALLFIFPITLLGKVVYPRYLFPAALFFTVAAALIMESMFSYLLQSTKLPRNRYQLIVYFFFFAIFVTAVRFTWPSLLDYTKTPFVASDKIQYLTEWSAGQGNYETAQEIKKMAQTQKIAVATEGYFGTLPDGILLYLHRQNVQNILVEGIGQPVREIPEAFIEKSQQYDTVWLVVNSHRLEMNLPSEKLVTEYCRPFNSPCLQVWDITDLVKTQ